MLERAIGVASSRSGCDSSNMIGQATRSPVREVEQVEDLKLQVRAQLEEGAHAVLMSLRSTAGGQLRGPRG